MGGDKELDELLKVLGKIFEAIVKAPFLAIGGFAIMAIFWGVYEEGKSRNLSPGADKVLETGKNSLLNAKSITDFASDVLLVFLIVITVLLFVYPIKGGGQ